MVGLLVYAYCLGVRSSRQIELAHHVDVGFRVILAALFPDHTTIRMNIPYTHCSFSAGA